MNTKVAMRGTAVQTDENSISWGCPRRLRGIAVETSLNTDKVSIESLGYHNLSSMEGIMKVQGQNWRFSKSCKDTYLILLFGSKLAQQSLTLLLGQGCHLQQTTVSVS